MYRNVSTTAHSTVQEHDAPVLEEGTMDNLKGKLIVNRNKPIMTHRDSVLPNTEKLTRRKLGGIEAMYNFYLSRGTDVLTMMSRVESVYPLQEPAVRWALENLMMRHPMLRSSIAQDHSIEDRAAVFVEKEKLELDFQVLDRSDWLDLILEEVHKPFDDRKTLWRCRMINAPSVRIGFTHSEHASQCLTNKGRENILGEDRSEADVYKHKSVFVFISHHSIMDGGYIVWIFQEFVNLMDAYLMNTSIGPLRELPFLPSIEDCIKCPHVTQSDAVSRHTGDSSCQMKFCYDSVNTTAIKDYNSKFQDEIQVLSKQMPKNEILFFKCSKDRTSAYMNACARENCKPPGAITAATILAFIDLIYPNVSDTTSFEIPFEFMVDLRRHYKIDNLGNELVPYYTGVATSHVSLSVNLDLGKRPVTGPEFWKIARYLATSLQDHTLNPRALVINEVKQEYESFTRDPEVKKQTGKSPYVLCLSNLGRLDNVIDEHLRERIRLTDVHGHSSTLIDHMPVFFVTTLSVNGNLEGNISYCRSYTSEETTLTYMRHLQRYIEQTAPCSKL